MILPSLKNTLTIVSGFPRTGTSTMMRMLDKGGITPVAHQRLLKSIDPFDPYGCYESHDVLNVLRQPDLRPLYGMALKVVTPHIRHLPVLNGYNLRVIFMQRDLNEVMASLLAMHTIFEDIPADSIDYARAFLKYHEIPTHFVKYRDLLQYPKTEAQRIAEFLRTDLDTGAMATAIDRKARYKLKDSDDSDLPMDRVVRLIDGRTAPITVPKGERVDIPNVIKEVDHVDRNDT